MIPQRLSAPRVPYTIQEFLAAHDSWGCNCGPGALATMLSLKPDDVRAHIPRFDERRYTNPTMMAAALRSLKLPFTECKDWTDNYTSPRPLADYGLVRIQWEGPWTDHGVPIAARYRKTHWIGSMLWQKANWIFDINRGWLLRPQWETETVPALCAEIKRATGKWHPTHRWELTFPN